MSEQENVATDEVKGLRTVEGRVTSNLMDKTATVLVERRVKHPLYKKYMRRSTKFHVHDENNDCQIGDTVMISQCRPISKTKAWRFERVVTRAD
ncbi:MAG: small subunit ribosomal protein S17 [Gammaproteobacteria bacterium]|jgi:small subunit ribosomal protein S17